MKTRNIALTVLLAAVAVAAALWLRPDDGAEGSPDSVDGTVVSAALSARAITVETSGGQEVVIALQEGTRLYSSGGDEISLADVVPGSAIEALGRSSGDDTFIPDEVRVVSRSEAAELDPCPDVLKDGDRGGTCGMPVGARVGLGLSAEYDAARASVLPQGIFGEVGGEARTFESVAPGKAVVSAPRADGGEPFEATIIVREADGAPAGSQ